MIKHNMKNPLYYLFFILFFSCQKTSTAEGNDYLYNLNNELTQADYNIPKLKAISDRELKKYKATNDKLYLLSSKYAEVFLHPKIEQIRLDYEMLKLNDNKYQYITIANNFNLALQFEFSSPKLSQDFLNEAIAVDEKTGKKFFLPHLYHIKGRLYYNKGDYSNAMLYFDKALKNYKKTDLLYIASMHNNFAMCYQKMNNLDMAIKESYTAIYILESKSYYAHTILEKDFVYYVKGKLSKYLIEKKDFSTAENLLNEELEFYKSVTGKWNKDYHSYIIDTAKDLFEVYTVTHQKDKQKQLVSFLQELEPDLHSLPDKIEVNKVFQKYYAAGSDLQNLKLTADKLTVLNDKYDESRYKDLNKLSDLLNDYVIKNVNQKYDYEIRDKERKNTGLIIFIFLLIVIFVILSLSIKNRNKKEKEIAEKQRLILEANKKILENNLQFNKQQVKNLQLSLHLKIETEKTFLENLKKIKAKKNINTEQILNNLLIKVNNLILIDKKNNDLLNESSFENKLFIEKLSKEYPLLTKQELKLCVYFRLNLSSKEISVIEDITDGSARVYKTKIKTKMGLPKEMELHQFLNNFTLLNT